ncbi:uncharacterized protein K02A2.6-like [Halichondria panicea]|uniref:uncharacterized protein K02A2.6-like n=1 Tax=Halichondria panicea TaxID=6063 RepID=UPI00312B68E4
MATRGSLQEFNAATDSITQYLERVDLYFTAQRIQDDLKVATLLSSIGASTYARLSDFFVPESRRKEKRKLAIHCGFAGDRLTEELRDQIVVGLRKETDRKRLLTEADLTYKRTLEIVQASESAEKTTKSLQRHDTSEVLYTSRKQKHQKSSKTPPQDQPRDCYRCGGKHQPAVCKFKEAVCHYCKKPGHIARVCRAKAKQEKGKKPTHHMEHSYESDDSVNLINHVEERNHHQPPYVVHVSLNKVPMEMEVDTGAAMSLISNETFRQLQKNKTSQQLRKVALKPTTIRLRTYSGQQLVVLGTLKVHVRYEAQRAALSVLVVEGSGPSLLGRDWLKSLQLNWKELAAIHYTPQYLPSVEETLSKHKGVFSPELGKAAHVEAKLQVEQDATPTFCKARKVPYALREKVENELNRLEANGIIEPVKFSNWAAPVVPVLKPDGSIRICGDYKQTVNKAAKLDPYPLPKIENLFARLAGGKKFTKLDIAHAYQ